MCPKKEKNNGKKKNLFSDNSGRGIWILLVKLNHICEGEAKADISLKHENIVRLSPQDLITEMIQPSSSSHRLILSQIPYNENQKSSTNKAKKHTQKNKQKKQ
jgi:hypothetical protein